MVGEIWLFIQALAHFTLIAISDLDKLITLMIIKHYFIECYFNLILWYIILLINSNQISRVYNYCFKLYIKYISIFLQIHISFIFGLILNCQYSLIFNLFYYVQFIKLSLYKSSCIMSRDLSIIIHIFLQLIKCEFNYLFFCLTFFVVMWLSNLFFPGFRN